MADPAVQSWCLSTLRPTCSRGARLGSSWPLGVLLCAAAECSCNCCIGEPRRPPEVDGLIVVTKCAAMPVHDERININNCIPTCAVDNLLSRSCAVVKVALLHYSCALEVDQFCLYHCQPTQTGCSLNRMQAPSHSASLPSIAELTSSLGAHSYDLKWQQNLCN
eukprot:1447357-Amphidinium_carterae.2